MIGPMGDDRGTVNGAAVAAMPQPSESRLWRALRHRNYRLFFGAQVVFLCGTILGQVANRVARVPPVVTQALSMVQSFGLAAG